MGLTGKEKKQRIAMMVFGAFAIFFTGYPHIWSLYQPYMRELTGWTQGQTSMCFYLALLTFVFGNIVGGRIQDKHNPRIAIFIGGAIFSAGILLSAFLIVPSPIPMYLTYGVMQGFGQGMIYTTILSIAQKWFPDKIGFASGVVVTANGLCGFFLAPVSRTLLAAGGPKMTFLAIGGAIALSWILGSLFIQGPQRSMKPADVQGEEGSLLVQRQYTSGEMVRTKKFYFLVLTMMCGLLSYFLISPVAQSVQTERGIPLAVAVAAVMCGSIANAVTRLLLPSLADKIGRVKCVKAILLVSVAAMVMLAVSRSYVTTVAVVMMYGCYGGIMGSFPSLTSSIFGMKHSGENYGYVMFGIIMATLGAPLINSLVDRSGMGMELGFKIGVGFAAASFVFSILLERELKKKKEEKASSFKVAQAE